MRMVVEISRAGSIQSASYLQFLESLAHSVGVKRSIKRPMASQRALTVRSAALRRSALSCEKAFSIGLKSGL